MKVKENNWFSGNVREFDQNESGFVTYDESYKRIIFMGIFIGLILASFTTFMVSEFNQITDKVTFEWNLALKMAQYGFKKPKILLLSSNGTLYQTEILNENLEKNSFMFQLPITNKNYFAFKEPNGVVSFIRDDLDVNIIQLTSDKIHSTIKKSKLSNSDIESYLNWKVESGFEEYLDQVTIFFGNAIVVGNKVWLTSIGYRTDAGWILRLTRTTLIWYTKRQTWERGPDIPEKVLKILQLEMSDVHMK